MEYLRKKYSVFFLIPKIGLELKTVLEKNIPKAKIEFIEIENKEQDVQAIISLLIVRIILATIMLVIILKNFGITVPRFDKIKDYLNFGLPTIMGNFAFWIIQSSDRYIINYFLGALYVGYYSPAYSIGNLIMLFIAPLTFILPAVLSKFYDNKQYDNVKKYLQYSLQYYLLIAIPAVVGLSVLAYNILWYYTTEEISKNSYFIVPFVGVSILLYGVYAIHSMIFTLKKNTRIGFKIWLFAAILNIGFNIIFIPKFGILGAAVATLIAYLTALLITIFIVRKMIRFKLDWIYILKLCIASILMTVFIYLIPQNQIFNLILTILGAIFIYIISIFILKAIDKKEIDFIKKLFFHNQNKKY